MNTVLNRRFLEVRKTLGLTQKELASRISISQGTVTDIERERIGVSSKVTQKLFNELNVIDTWFYTGKGERFNGLKNTEINRKEQGVDTGDNTGITGDQSIYLDPIIKSLMKDSPKMEFLFKAVEDLKVSNPEISNIRYDISNLAALLVDAENIYLTYLSNALNNDIAADSYSDYKAKLVTHLNSYAKYNVIIQPFIKSMQKFILDFKKYDSKNIIEAYDELGAE